MEEIIICVDFDGSVVQHCYTKVGKDCPGAVDVIKKLVKRGHKIILFTMRSGVQLGEAVDWYKSKEIPLYGININPTQQNWTSSPKAYAQLYIDDAALGIPLIYPENKAERPYIDWYKVEELLIKSHVL